MRALKILYLASFSGNLGNNANYMGFRPWFEAQLGRQIIGADLEIREFYWKERAFDEEFAKLVNTYAAFLDRLLAPEQYLVSVRNDGAIEAMETHVDEEHADLRFILFPHIFRDLEVIYQV